MENLFWGVWGWNLDQGPILWEVVDYFPNEVCEDTFRKLCHLRLTLTQNYHDLEKIYDLEKINVGGLALSPPPNSGHDNLHLSQN